MLSIFSPVGAAAPQPDRRFPIKKPCGKSEPASACGGQQTPLPRPKNSAKDAPPFCRCGRSKHKQGRLPRAEGSRRPFPARKTARRMPPFCRCGRSKHKQARLRVRRAADIPFQPEKIVRKQMQNRPALTCAGRTGLRFSKNYFFLNRRCTKVGASFSLLPWFTGRAGCCGCWYWPYCGCCG